MVDNALFLVQVAHYEWLSGRYNTRICENFNFKGQMKMKGSKVRIILWADILVNKWPQGGGFQNGPG